MFDFTFDILKLKTWDLAREKPFFWKGTTLFRADTKRQFTELDIVSFFEATYNFIEKDGDFLSGKEKITGIKTILNRMLKGNTLEALYQADREARATIPISKVPKIKKGSLTAIALAKMKSREAAWGAAVNQATEEFAGKGIKNPDDTTSGFRERINELYNASGENDKG